MRSTDSTGGAPAARFRPSRARPGSGRSPQGGERSARASSRSTGRLVLGYFRIACWLTGVVGIACGLYMTLRPSSNLVEIPWLPRAVAKWADSYGRFRNFPAYATLAAPFMIVCNGRRARFRALRWLALFAASVEAAQYFIPSRWCEWQDVAWSWAGLAATWLVAEMSWKVAWLVRSSFRRRRDPARVSGPMAAPPASLRS